MTVAKLKILPNSTGVSTKLSTAITIAITWNMMYIHHNLQSTENYFTGKNAVRLMDNQLQVR
jgi:hypothetical protein